MGFLWLYRFGYCCDGTRPTQIIFISSEINLNKFRSLISTHIHTQSPSRRNTIKRKKGTTNSNEKKNVLFADKIVMYSKSVVCRNRFCFDGGDDDSSNAETWLIAFIQNNLFANAFPFCSDFLCKNFNENYCKITSEFAIAGDFSHDFTSCVDCVQT